MVCNESGDCTKILLTLEGSNTRTYNIHMQVLSIYYVIIDGKDTIEWMLLRSLITEIVSSKPVIKNILKTVYVVVNNISAANLQNSKELVDSSTVLL